LIRQRLRRVNVRSGVVEPGRVAYGRGQGGVVPVEWSSGLEIGVEVIDTQHRELFARVAAFEAALERADTARIADTFSFLREYALVHFAREEALMRDATYSWLDDYRAAHVQFVARLAALVREREAKGANAFLGLRARNWIVVWLLDHVGGTDQALGRYLRGRSGKTPRGAVSF